MRGIVLGALALVGCRGDATQIPDARPLDAPPADHDAPVLPDGQLPPIAALRFGIVGDTRPPSPDDTLHYPTAIITRIWQDLDAETPALPFVISTGDYMFANAGTSEQQPQLALYERARATYAGVQFPALGNHECTGATASNCGAGNADGLTKNYQAFLQVMLGPIGVTTPYYVEHVAAADASWTAKLVFVACNAWDAGQASWLDAALAEPTTYTFVVRHEGVDALSGSPCSASQPILEAHPLTLLIVGHTHTYRHQPSARQVIVGNGGAPLTSGRNYGYAVVARRDDGAIALTAYDYLTHNILDAFAVLADGSPAP